MISSFGRGVQVVKEYWEKKGLDVFPLRMNDGSGLAPADKVSAGFMGELLVYMATESAVSDAFIASLPQAGIEVLRVSGAMPAISRKMERRMR